MKPYSDNYHRASADSSPPREIVVNPLVYYQKPSIGQDLSGDTSPVQLVFPSGAFGLGLPLKNTESVRTDGAETENSGVVASAPQNSTLDRRQIMEYKLAFLALALVNIILTCWMYGAADEVDTSRVEAGTGYLSSAFTKVPNERRHIENVNFSFVIILLFIGAVSAWAEQATGLSAYAMGILLNFFLATPSLPFFVYSTRYFLDFFMLYLALVLRSRLVVTFLVIG